MQQTVTEQAGQGWLVGHDAIALDFEEGQEVTLLAGAKIGGLTTRVNQPGKVVHVQYHAEFGTTYVVAFGKLGMYARVGAEGLEAVAEETPVVVAQQGEKTFYNVSDLIADLKGGKFTPSQPAERLPLTTPVILRNGVSAVVSGHSTASCTSYRVSWYDRVHLVVRHKWMERGAFEVISTANKTATAA
ncbi:MAG: hypothetical protein ABI700_00770 [Chloroflexota bacterium]